MKQRFISIFLMLSFLLPMGISLSHAMHDHESFVCKSENEYHSHPEPSGCDQIHLINYTLSHDGVQEYSLSQRIWFNRTTISLPHLFTPTVLATESDRGPPVINV